MTDAHYKYQHSFILNLADQTIVADAVAPEFCELTLQCFALLARLFKVFQMPKELHDSMGSKTVDFAQLLGAFAVSSIRQVKILFYLIQAEGLLSIEWDTCTPKYGVPVNFALIGGGFAMGSWRGAAGTRENYRDVSGQKPKNQDCALHCNLK